MSTESYATEGTGKDSGDTRADVQDVIYDVDGVDIFCFLFVHRAGVSTSCGGGGVKRWEMSERKKGWGGVGWGEVLSAL